MTRQDILRAFFTKESKLIEVGASYNPVIPKAEGWQTTIIDHAEQDQLRIKYRDQNPDIIEPVDAVWRGEPLDTLFRPEALGTFDGLIASHVGEHLPDFVGFLVALDKVLSPKGVIVLALPDKRLCFDFFRPVTTTGALLDAHFDKKQRHSPGQVFDSHAYFSLRNESGAWERDLPLNRGAFKLFGTVEGGFAEYQKARASNEYFDSHGWCWTSTSFQLNMIELYQLGVIPWTISRIERADSVEFLVWLERRAVRLSAADCEARRLRLLLRDAQETASDVLGQLTERSEPATVSAELIAPKLAKARISAVIPLYNGSRFITGAIESIMRQTVIPDEIIVVNDGSTDQGAALVRAQQTEHPDWPVILINQANAGQSAARNAGVQHSSGDYIALMDQDDAWYPTHLEELLKPFQENPHGPTIGLTYSNLDQANVDGAILLRNWLTAMQPPVEHPKSSIINCLNRDMYILPTASLILRKAFDEVGGFDASLSGYEDDDLFMRIFHAGYGHVFVNKPLSKWRIHRESASYTARMARSRHQYCQKLLQMFPDDPDHMHIFYSRDVILPRFYPHALVELRQALLSRDVERVNETRSVVLELLDIASHYGIFGIMNARRARFLANNLRRLSPRNALRLYQVRQTARPILRRLMLRRG